MAAFGLDTSNYTTSAALWTGDEMYTASAPLPVPPGQLGLRQNEALFHHVKQLPDIVRACVDGAAGAIDIIGASTRPRAVEGSYMPCFLAGESGGRSLAAALGVPFCAASHQQGHVAAALWSAGLWDRREQPILAWHVSGGTTELLCVTPPFVCQRIGGTTDLAAGQLVDRVGAALGLPFPAGAALEAMTAALRPVRQLKDVMDFSLSGIENQARGLSAEERPAFVLSAIRDALLGATRAALRQYPGHLLLCAGGVMSNRLIKDSLCETVDAHFAQPQYARDNAAGIALLASLERVS